MSKFYVGQRVRINLPASTRHGEECVIESGLIPVIGDISGNFLGHQVSLRHLSAGYALVFEPRELIPIYDGDQPAAFDASIWQPNHNTVLARDVGAPTFTLAELVAIDKQRVANGR